MIEKGGFGKIYMINNEENSFIVKVFNLTKDEIM